MPVETLNLLVGIGTIVLQAVTVALLVAFLLRGRVPLFEEVIRPFGRYGYWIALLAALTASVLSLYYSLVVGYPPCELCWWQRIFMYPQVVLFALALWLQDSRAALYSIALSVIGLGIGIYNHLLQVAPAGTLPCPAQGVSCSQIFYLEFGYITFPMLAITFFAFLIVLMLIVRRDA